MPVVVSASSWVNPERGNLLQCVECGILGTGPLSDAQALRGARRHVEATGHAVLRHRTRVQRFRLGKVAHDAD